MSAHALLLSLTPFPHSWSNKTRSIQVWLWHRDGPWCLPRLPSLVSATWGACNRHVPRPGPQNTTGLGAKVSVSWSLVLSDLVLCAFTFLWQQHSGVGDHGFLPSAHPIWATPIHVEMKIPAKRHTKCYSCGCLWDGRWFQFLHFSEVFD